MESTVDRELRSLGRSLQEYIKRVRQLDLNFAAMLLDMAALEIKMNLHNISQQELDTLCACIEAMRLNGKADNDDLSRINNKLGYGGFVLKVPGGPSKSS